MIKTAILAPLVLATVLLSPVAALAQTGEDESTAANLPADKQQASASENNSGASAGAAPKPARNERSPSEYRASEKISEDLPVSFPVDI
ncbi:MAG: hypothetical protein H6985_05680 [Pseudomonadales bacterium]|nr:hypothetical protein [Halioglobus sp.]MCP5129057.1 hypothetical protein [Pseudomonadales bacterium]